jgi:nucleoside-diphosphate-sugar epimerase
VILVTGAAGFIGRAVCAQLRREEVAFLGADRSAPEAVSGCRTCDVTDTRAVAFVFEAYPVRAVIHLAGMLPTACHAQPIEAARINIGGAVNLLEAACWAGVRRFVFGSSMSVYGASGDGRPVSEESPPFPTEVYGAAKRYVEILGEAAARNHHLSFAALRIATVVGPGAWHTASPWRSQIFEKADTGIRRIAIPYPEDAMLSLVHVEDAARMLVLLASRDALPHEIYNSPAGNLTCGELKRLVEKLDRNLAVELCSSNSKQPPPVADGMRFVQDFAWRAPSLVTAKLKSLYG